MGNEVIGRCPVCHEAMEVSELQCPACRTRISGRFDLCKFCKLEPEQREFAEVFIKNRGNIREVEKELGISYPTVRNRLESLVRAMGYSVPSGDGSSEEERTEQKKDIIDKLSRGEITPQEATRRLRNLAER